MDVLWSTEALFSYFKKKRIFFYKTDFQQPQNNFALLIYFGYLNTKLTCENDQTLQKNYKFRRSQSTLNEYFSDLVQVFQIRSMPDGCILTTGDPSNIWRATGLQASLKQRATLQAR